MRRIAVIGAAMLVLGGVATALAANTGYNNYTAKYSITPKSAGSKHKPVPVGITLTYTAKNQDSSMYTAPIIDVTTKMYGLIADGKDFPKCSFATISAHADDSSCDPKAMVATGFVHATLTANLSKSTPGTIDCKPYLHVWNSGEGKLTFFFTAPNNQNVCGPIHTGAAPPYPGTVKKVGKYLVVDAKVGENVSFPVGLYGALSFEHLKWFKLSKKKGNKTVAFQASVACPKNGKRPIQTIFTAEDKKGGKHESVTVKSTAKC